MSKIVRNNCCVVGCSNNEDNHSELHYYRFPGRSYEKERKKQWILAIKRVNEYDKHWVPGREARVCSAHFIGGKKSENMHDVAYIPRIFPVYRKKIPDRSRAKRLRRHKIAKPMPKVQNFETKYIKEEYIEEYIKEEAETTKKVNSGMQTEPCTKFPSNEMSVLYCWNEENEASTQANTHISKPQQK